jgi:hypothetical protein
MQRISTEVEGKISLLIAIADMKGPADCRKNGDQAWTKF